MKRVLFLVALLLQTSTAFADRQQFQCKLVAPGAAILFSDGSAAAPSMSFASDPNTGIFRPTSGTIAVSTNSAERMRITANANVGIGTSTPTAINSGRVTQIVNSSNTSTTADNLDGIFESVNRNASLYIRASNTSASTLHFGDQADAGIGRIQYDHATNNMTLRTNSIDRLSVKSNGQVRFVPLTADPASPEAGDVYYNSSTNKLRVYNGTAWTDLH